MDLRLRPYQERIVASIGDTNAIIKMPTGSGKTIVAAAIMKQRLEQDPSRAALLLVPALDLVDQQSLVLKDWCPDAEIFRFSGGIADPPEGVEGQVCIVSTPQAFLNLQKRKNDLFGWHAFGIVVFDEVHHVLKEHPYRHLALRLKRWNERSLVDPSWHPKVQVLGLSASLTYDVTEARVTNTLNRLCWELGIEKMESPSNEELEEGGYVPQHGRNMELDCTTEVPEGVIPRRQRKNHLMYSTFMDRVDKKTATPFSLKIWSVIKYLEGKVAEKVPAFQSPLLNEKLASWEQCVYDISVSQPWNASILGLLEKWYIGLRLLVQTWEEEELLVMQWLKMQGAFDGLEDCQDAREIQARAANPENFYRLGRLRFHLMQKNELKGDTFKCVVFVQQRIAAVILSHFINSDPDLQSIGLKAGFVTARASKITPRIKVTKSMAKDTIAEFRTNDLNVIVATKVLEEGFDVPAANVVISYDHLKDAVEYCQRSGRARDANSSIVILDERPDRPLTMLEAVHTMQNNLVEGFDPSTVSINEEMERSKQLSREQGALRSVLQKHSKTPQHSIQAIHEYTAKTKATLTDDYIHADGLFTCTLTYHSILRRITVDEQHTSKKSAKQCCALELLTTLERVTSSL